MLRSRLPFAALALGSSEPLDLVDVDLAGGSNK
jgi:hypothetical protein